MKSPVLRIIPFFSLFLLLLAAGIPNAARAQWHADSIHNTPVCVTAGAQDMPKGCTDGADGAIITWEDARTSGYQIYAQHLDAAGKATWTANGVKLATVTGGTYAQTMPIIATDDSGGAYIVWLDARYSKFGNCIFAQHIRADGTLAYPDTALPVAIGLNGCANPTLCDDGRGGAYVAWEDNRAANIQTRPNIWMNRLWPGGVKFGLTTTGTKAVVSSSYNWFTKKTTYSFIDSSANFQSYLVNQSVTITGKGSYLIASVLSPTQLDLKSYPTNGTYAYYIPGLSGMPLDTFANKQTGPSITSDGNGGCYLAWTSSATNPNSIYATRIDSTGIALWDPAPAPGFLVYKDPYTGNHSKNVWINRDGTDLLLTWEVTNSTKYQDVYAVRMHDSLFAWGAVNVSDQIDDQTLPRIYGDDSAMKVGTDSTRGVLVPFLDQEPSPSDDLDVAMVRVMGTGGTLMPATGNGFWFFDQKPHTQSGMRTVKITDASNGGTATGVLAVWNDAWDGVDTMVYAQRIDRVGRKYFPTVGTSNRWGLAISGDSSATRRWTAKQVTLIPRGTNGGIAVWTDLRNGNADIYAQLILADGVSNIPTDLDPPVSSILSQTGSFDGSACNSRCTDALAVDTGSLASGVASIVLSSKTNMKFTAPTFTMGADSVAFNVCVMDSMLDGSASIAVTDVAGNERMENFTYCTIADTLPPLVTWDSSSGWLHLHFTDNRPWDRGLDSILVTDTANVSFTPALTALKDGAKSFDVVVTPANPALPSSFSIQAVDTDGNRTPVDSFAKTLASVTANSEAQFSLSIFPNPTSGAALVTIQGAAAGEVSVYDVLGRQVAQFHLEGSYEWNPGTLPLGTYYVRANIGGVILSKSIVRE